MKDLTDTESHLLSENYRDINGNTLDDNGGVMILQRGGRLLIKTSC